MGKAKKAEFRQVFQRIDYMEKWVRFGHALMLGGSN